MSFNKRRLCLCLIDIFVYLAVFAGTIFVIKVADERMLININDYAVSAGVFGFFLIAYRIILSIYKNVWRYANSKSFLKLLRATK